MENDEMALAAAAKHTALSEPTIRRHLAEGRIVGRKLGRDWFIPESEVKRLARIYPLRNLATHA